MITLHIHLFAQISVAGGGLRTVHILAKSRTCKDPGFTQYQRMHTWSGAVIRRVYVQGEREPPGTGTTDFKPPVDSVQ